MEFVDIFSGTSTYIFFHLMRFVMLLKFEKYHCRILCWGVFEGGRRTKGARFHCVLWGPVMAEGSAGAQEGGVPAVLLAFLEATRCGRESVDFEVWGLAWPSQVSLTSFLAALNAAPQEV